MQGQVGPSKPDGTVLQFQTHATTYRKLANITGSPGSSDLIIFLEESGCDLGSSSRMDGWLQVDNAFTGPGTYGQATFPDVPGAFHKWGSGFSFADGHSEYHKWLNPGLKIPVTYGCSPPGGTQGVVVGNALGATAVDWRWFTSHCAGYQP
jgi:hypothetical protein